MADCLLVVDRTEAVIQQGQPTAVMGAWIIPIPDGQTAEQAASEFATTQGFPVGSTARVIDLSKVTVGLSVWTLTSQWVQETP
jgi:hypothetical protein